MVKSSCVLDRIVEVSFIHASEGVAGCNIQLLELRQHG